MAWSVWRRRIVPLFAAASIALLALAAYALVDAQSSQFEDLRDRYDDRAKVAASLIDSVFQASLAQQRAENRSRFGGERVPAAALAARQRESNLRFAMVLDEAGRPLALTPTAPPAFVARLRRDRSLLEMAADDGFALSDVGRGGADARPFVANAQSFDSDSGRRFFVSGFDVGLIAAFLSGTLSRVPNVDGGRGLVIDSRGLVLGDADGDAPPGRRLREGSLLRAMESRDSGDFSEQGEDSYFVAERVHSSPWRVVLSAPDDELYASLSGPGRWVPWVILVFSGLALLAVALLLRRVVTQAAHLARANRELEERGRALERRAEELRRSNRDLEQFAYVASHDLSEPLRIVSGMSELLSTRYRGRLDADADEFMAFMNDAVERMQKLIDDLLEYSRIQAAEPEMEPVDMGDVTASVLRELDSRIQQSGADIEVGEMPVVMGERHRLAQVLSNLLLNALKFARPGTAPQISVYAETDNGGWRICVRDDGMGIDPEHAERIFKMFQRLHSRTDYPGTGIGLAICKRIVERHGGRIWVEPVPGQGSVFCFTLTAAAPARAARGEEAMA